MRESCIFVDSEISKASFSDLFRDDREPLAMLTGTRSFDRGVERKKFGLEDDIVDDLCFLGNLSDHMRDLGHPAVRFGDRGVDLFIPALDLPNRIRHAADRLAPLSRAPAACTSDRGGAGGALRVLSESLVQFSYRRGRFFQGTRGFRGGIRELMTRRIQLLTRGRQSFTDSPLRSSLTARVSARTY